MRLFIHVFRILFTIIHSNTYLEKGLRFSGCAERDDDLFVTVEEIEDLGSARDDPGEGVEQVERGDRVEISEDRVDPDHAEHARAEEDEDHRHKALADAARGGGGVVHQRGEGEDKAHDPDALKARVDNGGLGGEEGEELPPEKQEEHPEKARDEGGVSEREKIALAHALCLTRAEVLPDEARAGDVEGIHHRVNEVIDVARGGVALDHDGAEGVDARLDEEVCDREDGVLQARGNADGQNVHGLILVEGKPLDGQAVDVLAAQQRAEDQSRRNALRDHTCKRHAVGRHAEADDERKVEDDVQHARDGEKQQRCFRVADGVQHAAAVVVERGGGHTQKVNAKVKLCAVDEVAARVEQLKERPGEDEAQRQHQNARREADDERRAHRLAHVLFAARAEVRGDEHVHAAAKAHQKACEEEDERCGRADRAHGGGAGKAADHGKVDHTEEHLQKIREHQRHGKGNDLPAETAFRHIERVAARQDGSLL